MLLSSNLTPQTVEGMILFDQQSGQVVESRELLKITGDLELSVGGNELAGKVDLTMGTSMTLLDQ